MAIMQMQALAKSLSALAGALALFSAPLWAAPSVRVETTAIEFGTVRQGEPVTAEVIIANTGSETLVIDRMEFSMPGLSARLKQKIPPGREAPMQLNWDTSRLRRAVEGRVTLFLNDPTMPRIDINLRGEVVPAIEFLPRPAFYFSQFTGESQTGTITLLNNRDEPLTVGAVSPSSDRFEFRMNATETGRRFELSVATRPDLATGRYRDYLLIATSDPDYRQLHVEVNILVKPDVFVSPDIVDFGTISRTELRSRNGAVDFVRQSVVINRRQGTMRIPRVTTDIPAVEVSVSPGEASKGFMLVAGIRPELLQTGPLTGNIRVETDDPSHPELKIEVKGTVTD